MSRLTLDIEDAGSECKILTARSTARPEIFCRALAARRGEPVVAQSVYYMWLMTSSKRLEALEMQSLWKVPYCWFGAALKWVESTVTNDSRGDGFYDIGFDIKFVSGNQPVVVRSGIHTVGSRFEKLSISPVGSGSLPSEYMMWKERSLFGI